MKAAIYKGIKQMACEERPKPTIIDDGDAIIRVVRACVCGSDLWFYRCLLYTSPSPRDCS